LTPRFLLDTHILLRWFVEVRKLSHEQRSVLEACVRQAEPLAISARSLLEIAILVNEGDFKLRTGLDAFFKDLESNPLIQVLPITYRVASEVAAIGSGLRDPADRTIVATARVHCLRLITSDQRIIESKLVPVVE